MNPSTKNREYSPWKKPPQKRWKTLLKAAFLALLLLVAGLGVLVMFLDKDTLRETLTQTLSEQTGTHVEIQFLDLSYSRGLALEAGGLTIRPNSGGAQWLWAESLLLEVKVFPLLTGEVVIENADIIKPRIKIFRKSGESPRQSFQKTSSVPLGNRTQGDYSMAGVIKPESPQEKSVQKETPPAPQPLLDRKNIDAFRNRLKKINLTADNIHVEQGSLIMIDEAQGEPHENQTLDFSFNLKIKRPAPEVIDVSLDDLHLSTGPLYLLGRIAAPNILSDASRLEVQVRTKPFDFSELKRSFQTPGVKPSAIPRKNGFPVQIEQLTLLASFPINSLVDVPTFSRDLKAEARFITKDAIVPVSDYEIPVTQVKGKARWEESFILYELNGQMLDGQVRIEGQQAFPLNSGGESNPMITTQVQLTGLDFAQVKVPETWPPPKGRISGMLKVTFPLSLEGPPFMTGTLMGENLVLASPGLKWVSRKTEIQFESPPEKPMSMEFTSRGVAIDRIRFKKIKGRLSFPPGKVHLEKSTWTPLHGTLTATGTYDTKSNKYQLEFLGKDLWAGDYSRNKLQGIIRAHGSVNGYIPEKLPAIRGLFGNLSVKVTPVNFEQVDEIKTLLAVIDPVLFQQQNLRGMSFEYLGGNFKINNGKFNTQNLALKGGLVDVYLTGLFDGHTQSLDMMGRALPKINMSKALKSSPQLAKLLSNAQAKGGLVETRFKLEGPAQKPQMTLLGIQPNRKSSKELLQDLKKKSPKELIDDLKSLEGLLKKK